MPTPLHRHDPIAPFPHKKIDDWFFMWLQWANPGHVNEGNIYCMDYAIRHLPSDNPILEIGTFVGLSTNQLTHCKRMHNRHNKLFTCDRWFFEGAPPDSPVGKSPILHKDYREFIRESYIRNARFFSAGDLPATIELFSDEFFDAWQQKQHLTDVFGTPQTLGGPLSFCFIDGNHTYDFAKRDWLNTDKYLEPGGFILFDDSADGSRNPDGSIWGVSKVIDEVKASNRYDVVIQNLNYLFIKNKHP